jgi:hypothetical protein
MIDATILFTSTDASGNGTAWVETSRNTESEWFLTNCFKTAAVWMGMGTETAGMDRGDYGMAKCDFLGVADVIDEYIAVEWENDTPLDSAFRAKMIYQFAAQYAESKAHG